MRECICICRCICDCENFIWVGAEEVAVPWVSVMLSTSILGSNGDLPWWWCCLIVWFFITFFWAYYLWVFRLFLKGICRAAIYGGLRSKSRSIFQCCPTIKMRFNLFALFFQLQKINILEVLSLFKAVKDY